MSPWPSGNDKLMDKLGIACHDCHSVGTIIHMAMDGEYAGHIVISDVDQAPLPRRPSPHLKRAGVDKDRHAHRRPGQAWRITWRRELGVDEVHSELLPAR